ncbi:MAG: HD domain-containing protein, partial [Chromatiales bacterium]
MVTVTSNLPAGNLVDQATLEQWLAGLPMEFSKTDRAYLRQAGQLALESGADLQAVSGENQVRHALSVAEILYGLRLDRETLAAAILLGVRRRAELDLAQLSERFGESTARMVDDLDRIGRLTETSARATSRVEKDHAENLRRLLLGIAEDVRVVLVVVAERLHLMRMARELPEESRRHLAEQTRDIYAPLANRLGIWQIKWELEDLVLRFLHPDEYRQIASQLDGRRADRERFISGVIELLHEKFREVGIEAEISGRPKHIYSIWRKMQRKSVDIEQIFDLRAVRVLVDDIAQCYAA